ncbi:MAG: DeoR/GlpR transcriptional regulator [Anaerolineae bacterium]|nr:DeoR/GlpR transcriptional regulator [Anaerolineae bacterium]
MLKQERESEIVRLLSQSDSGVLSVAQLSRLLSVSEMTIRRDLETLANQGLVKRIHGGAVHVNSALLFERSFAERGRESRQAKVAIGRTAAGMVHDGQVIILDAGTTTLEVARHLAARRVTAVTNALPVASELSAHTEVSAILLGGEVKGPELCTVGPMVTESLSRMSADLLFLSTAGFSPDRGLTEPDLREAEVKRAMMRVAKRVCLVADSSKYGAVYFAQTAPITSIHAVVTDEQLSANQRSALEAAGIEVIIASPASPSPG